MLIAPLRYVLTRRKKLPAQRPKSNRCVSDASAWLPYSDETTQVLIIKERIRTGGPNEFYKLFVYGAPRECDIRHYPLWTEAMGAAPFGFRCGFWTDAKSVTTTLRARSSPF